MDYHYADTLVESCFCLMRKWSIPLKFQPRVEKGIDHFVRSVKTALFVIEGDKQKIPASPLMSRHRGVLYVPSIRGKHPNSRDFIAVKGSDEF